VISTLPFLVAQLIGSCFQECNYSYSGCLWTSGFAPSPPRLLDFVTTPPRANLPSPPLRSTHAATILSQLILIHAVVLADWSLLHPAIRLHTSTVAKSGPNHLSPLSPSPSFFTFSTIFLDLWIFHSVVKGCKWWSSSECRPLYLLKGWNREIQITSVLCANYYCAYT
jgi:hypothetical protein